MTRDATEMSGERTARIGDVMPDGTVYAGISPTTGTRMFALPADAPKAMNWNEALRYAFNLEAHGYKGSRQQAQRDLMDARKDDGGRRLSKAMTWNEALRYAFNLEAHGYKGSRQQTQRDLMDGREDDGGWRLPTGAELEQLYRNKDAGAFRGTFTDCDDGYGVGHLYWSRTEHAGESKGAWSQSFTNGDGVWGFKDFNEVSVRCVRTEPRP